MSGNGETTVLDAEVINPEAKAGSQAIALRYSGESDADLAICQGVTVETEEQKTYAGELRLSLERKVKQSESARDALVRPLNDHVRWINSIFKPAQTKWKEGMLLLSSRRLAFEDAQRKEAERVRKIQEEAARKEQARLDKLAREKAEAAERKAREEAEKAAAIRREAELVAAREKDGKRAEEILRQAEEAAQKAEAKSEAATEKAMDLLETVPQVAMPVGPVYVAPKTAGVARQTYWFHRVINLPALVMAVAAGEVPEDAVMANDQWLGKTAKALQKNMRYPGVETYSEERERGTGR